MEEGGGGSLELLNTQPWRSLEHKPTLCGTLEVRGVGELEQAECLRD